MKTITVKSIVENVDIVTDFVDEYLDDLSCPKKAEMQINVAIDELFSNVCKYAYGENVGEVTVSVGLDGEENIVIVLADKGKPYDPTAAPDPDVSLSAEDRMVGGLGLFVVKKTMDELSYRYDNGENKVTIKKKIV